MMKAKKMVAVLIVVALTLALMPGLGTALAAPPPTYEVVVNGGTAYSGDGAITKAECAELIKLVADIPAGKVFDHWEVITGYLPDADDYQTLKLSPNTNWFTMRAQKLEVTAHFKDMPADELPIKVNNGYARKELSDGTFVYAQSAKPGDTVKLARLAPRSGTPFSRWEINSGGVSFDTTKEYPEFTMGDEPVEVTAIMRGKPLVNKIRVINGVARDPENNDVTTKTANFYTKYQLQPHTPPGKTFDKWVVLTSAPAAIAEEELTKPDAKFKTNEQDFAIAATFKGDPTTYKVKVNSGKAYAPGGLTIIQSAEVGQEVILNAGPAPEGQVFARWVVNTGEEAVYLKNAKDTRTTFIMPPMDVEVTATYKDADVGEFDIKVNEGTAKLGSKTVTKADEGQRIELIGNDLPGKVFDKWVVNKGAVNLGNPNMRITNFIMPAENVEVTATYKEDPDANNIKVNEGIARIGSTPTTKAKEGDTVTIVANAAQAGQVFDKWVVDSGTITLANANAETTSFTMPAEDVEVTATYKADPTLPKKHKVTVNKGKAQVGGATVTEAEENAEVTIIADAPPAGQVFDKWVVDSGTITLADANAETTTFTMPARDVEVTATYKTAAPTEYNVTVNDGHAEVGGVTITIAQENDNVILLADTAPAGQVFDKWVVNSGSAILANAAATTTSFTMPAEDVEVTATYRDKETPPDGQYLITVNNGSATVGGSPASSAAVNAEVNLDAFDPPAGQEFDKWVVVRGDVTFIDANAPSTYFIMPAEDVEVTATYKNIEEPEPEYNIKVNRGQAEDGHNVITKAKAGANVTIAADAPEAGYVFDKWVVDSGAVTLADANAATTGFVMPAEDVELTATYKADSTPPEKYNVTVNKGIAQVGGVTVTEAEENDEVTIVADAPPAGYVFDKWVVDSGAVTLADANAATTTFTMPAEDVEVTATYKKDPSDPGGEQPDPKPDPKQGKEVSKKPKAYTRIPLKLGMRTGDTTPLFIIGGLLGVSLIGLIFVGIKWLRKR